MPTSLPPYLTYLLTSILAMAISIYGVRKTIFIARNRNLYDKPDDIRKIHGAEIPSMGGIGIFVGYIAGSAIYWYWCGTFLPFFMVSSALLLFTGIYDDIMNMQPVKKLLAQLAASFITLGVITWQFILVPNEGNLLVLLVITSFLTLCCTFFINVFNFIDGIDGLACSLGILYTISLGVLLWGINLPAIAGLAFTLAGATSGLLLFNKAPAKIYMGDTGSMFIGFSIFVLAFICVVSANNPLLWNRYVYVNWTVSSGNRNIPDNWPVANIVMATLFVPVFDALRVFALRISRKTSPLKADRTHLHYYLLDAGSTHTQAVGVIVGTNVLCMGAAYCIQDAHPAYTVACCTAINAVVLLLVLRARNKKMSVKN